MYKENKASNPNKRFSGSLGPRITCKAKSKKFLALWALNFFPIMGQGTWPSPEPSALLSGQREINKEYRYLVFIFYIWFLFVAAQSEGKGSSSQRLVSSLSTLYLISKIKPQLLVKHAMTLQPYLSTKCSVSTFVQEQYRTDFWKYIVTQPPPPPPSKFNMFSGSYSSLYCTACVAFQCYNVQRLLVWKFFCVAYKNCHVQRAHFAEFLAVFFLS